VKKEGRKISKKGETATKPREKTLLKKVFHKCCALRKPYCNDRDGPRGNRKGTVYGNFRKMLLKGLGKRRILIFGIGRKGIGPQPSDELQWELTITKVGS